MGSTMFLRLGKLMFVSVFELVNAVGVTDFNINNELIDLGNPLNILIFNNTSLI